MKFNLDILSPSDFERLSRDIISRKLGLEFKVFSDGKDGGVDLRNYGNGIICQCKHYKNYSNLNANLKKELLKLQKIKDLKKYYLFLSMKLTPENEKEIIELFKDYKLSSEQIISYNEIEQFLEDEKNIDILRKNTKLWLTSYQIIELFSQRYIDFSNSILRNNINECIKYFVETETFRKCYEKINNDRILIISGLPGVGKTVNTNMLVAKLMAKFNFKLKTIVSSDYHKLIESFVNDNLELIILDDFLGQSSLEKSEDEINEIISIINYVKNNSKKYLILNSRLSVLSDAKLVNEKFSRILDMLDSNNYIINMSDVTRLEKAEILFNLHYYNNVPQEYFNELKKKGWFKYHYESIIDDKNYNTRIIEYCALNYKRDGISSNKYYDYIKNNLENSRQVWKKQFEKFTSEEVSYLQLMLSISTSNVPTEILKECYENVIRNRKYDSEKINFNNITEKMSNSLIIQSIDNKKSVINVINPSINDFIISTLKDNTVELERMIDDCIYIEQFINLINLNPSLLNNVKINILDLKSINNEFEKRLLILINQYDYCDENLKNRLYEILNNNNFDDISTIIQILSTKKIVNFYDLDNYILNIDYLKNIIKKSNNYYIKRFFEYFNDFIDDYDEDITDYIINMQIEMMPIIEEKIADDIYSDIYSDIDDIVSLNGEMITYRFVDGDVEIDNLSEIVNIVTEDLIPIIDEKIESEIVDYSFNNIKFENLTIQSDECFDSSQIEQSINDYIEAQNRNSGDNILNEEYSIHDIFSQKYIFD